MRQAAASRGQPLLVLAGLLAGWTALRVALWQPIHPDELPLDALAEAPGAARAGDEIARMASIEIPALPFRRDRDGSLSSSWHERSVAPRPSPGAFSGAGFAAAISREAFASPPARVVVGHNLLFVAALSQVEIAPALLAYLQPMRAPQRTTPGIPDASPGFAATARPTERPGVRWSADAWLLLRSDAATPPPSSRPVYGRSQAGGAIRYGLSPKSPLRPQAYLRAGTALGGEREREVAAGLSARPVAGLPFRVAAEARLTDTGSETSLRPAAFVVSEFPPVKLPLGLRGEAYAQAGYVGGDFATGFVDGQARIEQRLHGHGRTEITAGAGVWGGAQEDSARLDVGPSAAVSFRVGDGRGRVAADYRFRVAGEAQPSNGPAVTLSAGF